MYLGFGWHFKAMIEACWSRVKHHCQWRVVYWLPGRRPPLAPNSAGRRRLGYWSGFCPQARGRHWDRRSRYGEK